MNYASVTSGIEAATVAWHPLGWRPQFFAEIAPFPSAVLAHHYPEIPNRGDINQFQDWPDATIDLLAAGTPCQAFSIAGLRQGLADPRGNLAIVLLAMVARYRPQWPVWENVAGVLSSNGGRDFSAFISGLAQLGYGFAWRVFDAQHFGVAQRRRRVFLVGHIADWRCAAAALFESAGMRGDPAPYAPGRLQLVGGTDTGAARGCWWDGGQISQTLDAVLQKGQLMPEKNRFPAVLVPTVAGLRARLLTVVECERLQGFADDYTRIPWRGRSAERCPVGPRKKAIGNAMPVPVMRWLGERIAAVAAQQQAAA